VTIISESAARRFFGNQNPVGRQISVPGAHPITLMIVGVSGDVRQFGPAADVPEQLYVPFQRFTVRDARLLVRSNAPTAATVNLIKDAVRAQDREQPVIDFRTLAAARDDALGPWRLTTILLGLFAAIALAIAAAGLGGIVAYSVGQRTEEFGIRLALGAEPGSVRWLIVSDGLRLVTAGLVIGLAAAVGSLGLMARLLVGVAPTDPPTYGVVAAVFLAVGLLACLLPARRATTIDPASVLKGA
jgi:putative ABC transport system permease protein